MPTKFKAENNLEIHQSTNIALGLAQLAHESVGRPQRLVRGEGLTKLERT
jgi:hypothetical protein